MGTNIDSSIFKILVATDNHLGYLEKDPERGNDSYNTFEEILQLAVAERVDFILLGGDLFHDNKPSRNSILRCMELLRKYTFGDKPVHFDFVSDPAENFPHLKNPVVNYKDPNLNVSIPVFSIHGNHDDPSGLGQHSPLEMFSTAGLINYFGRIDNLNEVKISPLLMTKGQTKLALYGLSAIKDERLFRLFRENKVTMLRPREEMKQWFNILVLHQNHTKHSISNYIPEEFLDSFLELVIWGHEHECLIEARRSSDDAFHIIQPGSSVATSLCAGEAVPKHVAILEVNNQKQMRITPHPIQTIRPFVFEDLNLLDHDLPAKVTNKQNHPIEEFVENHVRNMIEESKKQHSGHPRQPAKPLIRLRVDYTDESQMFNICRFGHKFAEDVANPDNIILFRKFRKDPVNRESAIGIDEDAMSSLFNDDVAHTKVEDLVEQYFGELESDIHQLQLLSGKGLACAVSQFVEKDDKDAIHVMFTHQVEKTAKHLIGIEDLEEDRIEEAIKNYRVQRQAKKEQEQDEVVAALSSSSRKDKRSKTCDDDFDSDLEILEDYEVQSTSRRGNRGGRETSNRGTASSRGRYANKTQVEEDYVPSKSSRTRGRGRAKAATTSRTPTIKESFARASSRSGNTRKSKGAVFDSDSDID